MGGSDLYALGLPVLLFQQSVDEDILLLVFRFWVFKSATPPNAHPFAEFIYFLGTKHKTNKQQKKNI